MGLPPLSKIPLILRPQAWLHRRHYGEVLSPIRWWGRIPFIFYLVSMFVGWLERKRSPLDPVVRSLVSARIAQMCLCEFCVDITSMKVAERTGSSDKLLAVADWRQSPLFSDEERLALEYADRIIGIRAGKIVYDGPSKQVDQAVLDAIYGEDAVSEAAV